MPDLSNLLGAVYGDGPSAKERDPEDEAHVEHEAAASERTATPAVPDWADDEHLDAAFAQWKPGPSDGASPVEHAFAKDTDDEPAPPLADDLAAALSEALVAASSTADSTADATPERTPQHFDFSAVDEDDDPTEEAEPPQVFAVFQPVEDAVEAVEEPIDEATDEATHLPEPQDLSKSDIEPDEHAETEQAHELGEVVAPEPAAEHHFEPEPAAEHHFEPEPAAEHHFEPEPEPAPLPSITSQRAAAAELTAASRPEAEPVSAVPAPAPAPAPVAEAEPTPVASVPLPVPAERHDGAVAPTTLPAGTRQWERSDDDILPAKPGKKFFSLSLRRG